MEESIDKKYVVLDVETNGLSSIYDDLLSISIYKPDDNKKLNRFLPLELNKEVYTTYINGITKKDLKNATPLTQEEFNKIIIEYELDKRTILIYGNIDEKFMKNYLKRKNIIGFDRLKFYNFKHDIISSSFSEGNITKDNLCKIYGIENITDIHTGENDCILEWELFKKMNGNKLLITANNVFELNNDYIVPVSYLSTYPNFKYYLNGLPKFDCKLKTVKKFEIKGNKIKKFDTNISGMTIEHLINTMLSVEEVDSFKYMLENKSKLKFLGKLPSIYNEILARFNPDGTITTIDEKDKEKEEEINKVIKELKLRLTPLIEYIKKSIFKNEKILSQELVISDDKKVLAKCDLSNKNSVLEIKTYSYLNLDRLKYQLYYESNGRNCYLLHMNWANNRKSIEFIISKVSFIDEIEKNKIITEQYRKEFQKKIECKDIKVIEYKNSKSPVKLKCINCDNEWNSTYLSAKKIKECPFCNPVIKPLKKQNKIVNKKVDERTKLEKYLEKLNKRSNGTITTYEYKGAKEKVNAKCLKCENEWNIRADHLLERCYCPKCRK